MSNINKNMTNSKNFGINKKANYGVRPKVRASVFKDGTGTENWYLRKKDSKKRDQWKEKKTSKKYSNQSGIEALRMISSQFEELASFANIEIDDSVVRKVEGIIALFVNLRKCTDYEHFTSAIFLYIRDFYDTSITSTVMTYLQQLFTEPYFKVQDSSTQDPNWLTIVRNLQTNWTLVKGNRAFKQFSKLMAILVTLGLCDVSNLTFDIAGFKMFDEDILKKHLSAYDLADAIFGTVTYFAEGAYLCFKTRSIQPLLLNDFSVLELDTEYTNVITWWDLVKNGNLERIVGMSDAEFGNRLDALIGKLSNLLLNLTGFDKRLVSDKVIKCKDIRNSLITHKISSGTRRAPFAVELFGDSNQGKTTFGDQLTDALLVSAELPTAKEYRAALNPGDKFFSNWTSSKLVAILDDLANEKSDFVEKPPTRAIIDICNNQMYYAPKAELESKGKCFVEPEVVLVTTNKKNLDAYAYSNCPYSIQRRMDLVMSVRCKDQFQRVEDGQRCGVDSRKVREFYTVNGEYTPPAIDDIWIIDIERAVQPNKINMVAGYAPVTWRGKKMIGVSSVEAIQCAIEYFTEHRRNQHAIMEHMKKRTQCMVKCPHMGCKHLRGFCPDHGDHEDQIGLEMAVALESVRRKFYRRIRNDSNSFIGRLESTATKTLYKKTNDFLSKWDWICLIPTEYLDNDKFVEFVTWYYQDEIDKEHRIMWWFTLIMVVSSCFFSFYFGCILIGITFSASIIFTRSMTKKMYIDELRTRNDNLPYIIRNTRDKYARALCYGSAAFASLYLISRVYTHWRSLNSSHGSLEPKTQEEVQERDSETNMWSKVVKRELPTLEVCKTRTLQQLTRVVNKNLLYASVDTGKEILMANVLMLDSNMLLIPNHYFNHGDNLKLTCRKTNPEAIGGKFDTLLSKSCSYHIPDTDFTVCYTSTGGSYKRIVDCFPTGAISTHPFNMLWRNKTGSIIDAKGLAVGKRTANGACVFDGGEYQNLTINTFGGLCGAVLLSDTKAPAIIGLHLGGKSGTPKGCFGTLTDLQIMDAVDKVRGIEGILKTGSGERFTPQVMDINILTEQPLHEKSPLNYLPEGSQFAYYGTCPGAVTSISCVRQTPISASVTDITGVENIWGKPKMKPEWFGWQTAMANASKPGRPFPHDLLIKSIIDYKRPLLVLASKRMWQSRPLTDHENLNGIPGCKFIDAIDLNTSVGYPLTGPKRRFVTELEPTLEAPCNRVLNEVMLTEIERVHSYYKRGERAYTIAKACKKDEVLPVAKGKCRIFYGNSLPLTFLVRKYYLPVIRFLQMNPLLSECAVGINCHGPEWDQFYRHVMHHGSERIFGGDYGKYDQKLPSQLLIATLRILIDIAKVMGYSDDDTNIMEAMSGDLVYSLIAFNGDLVGLQSGTHISGNSLTVILNGISGSLNLRNFFYTKYPNSVHFRSAAHMMTYGDDNIGTVSPNYPEFNIKSCSEFLESYGQVYTMPDKESALKPYINASEFEFLKRTSVYHPKLDCNVGALVDNSIFKSLHCYLRPKKAPLTPNEACAQNIDTALREWFNHGPDVYEMRRIQMTEIAQRSQISHMCTLLNETYDDMCEDWREKYAIK